MDFVQPQKMARVFLQYALSISQAIHREDFALVVFVFPRQTQCENGVGFFTDGVSERGVDPVTVGRLRVAIAELSGLVIAGDHIAYEQLTEELFARIMQEEVSLPPVRNLYRPLSSVYAANI
ncbi:unnamed protein product [Phytophthora lilii]|uniref:Unnamed protein product n=1 Tax=Phytophthora lilii TaxID=2077276 RepID=A0A9W6TYK5_9STRA|nr:unnamed protein product [Phytophthora lilii]